MVGLVGTKEGEEGGEGGEGEGKGEEGEEVAFVLRGESGKEVLFFLFFFGNSISPPTTNRIKSKFFKLEIKLKVLSPKWA